MSKPRPPAFCWFISTTKVLAKDVWFDNLRVSTYASNVIEEYHYYPFGLTLHTSPLQTGMKNYKLVDKELEKIRSEYM